MYEWAGGMMDALWHNGLAAIPLVLVAAMASRFLPCLPATRHLIWVTVLVWLVGSSLLPQAPIRLIGNSTKVENLSPVVAPKPAISEPVIESRARKPRSLNHRLAKKNAAAGMAAGWGEHSEGFIESTPLKVAKPLHSGPPIPASNDKKPTRDFTPPPRSAARAETLAPDKLARVQETAGPRPIAQSRLDGGSASTQSAEKLNLMGVATYPAPQPHILQRWDANTLAPKAPLSIKHEVAQNEAVQSLDESVAPIVVEKQNSWRAWSGALMGVRDAVSRVPPLPKSLWLGGSGLLLLLAGLRGLSFRRQLRCARIAPHDVRKVVESACRELGLNKAPQTVMVDGRISPMVWCGVTPKLVLPAVLWGQLDELGRRAVVFHELAHIRRLDHRTAWIESAVGLLYWWHPLVWWVRGRLHAEAENCCDAWVMTLLPRTRRAYATALLKTREYLSGGGSPVPAMGIGITPGRARLFARRLTMVMTESVRPRLSATGISLVMLVVACGWVAAPARSCPEEKAAAVSGGGKAPCVTAKAPCNNESTPCAKAMSEVEAAKAGERLSTFEKHMAEREAAGLLVSQPLLAPVAVGGVVAASGPDAARAKRVAELQAEIARLERKMEALSEQLEEDEADNEGHDQSHNHAHDHDRKPAPPRATRPPMPPRAPHAAMSGTPAPSPVPPVPPLPPVPAVAPTPRPGQSWADVTGAETSWKTYKLSKGKGEVFYKFMARSDVPIWVRSNSEGIDIQATPRQHEVFEAFFALVDPSAERERGAALFGFGPMLAYAHGGCGAGRNCTYCMQAAEHRAMAEELRAKARAEAVELRAKARGDGERVRAMAREEAEKARMRLRRHARDARSEALDQQEMMDGLERQSQVFAELAESYREQAERINERAESMSQRTQKDAELAMAAGAYRLHVESLERSAEELNRQAEQLQREVELMEQRTREIEERTRQMEQHAEELDERAEAVREAVETLETGVEPTEQLVEAVLALVGNIESLVPDLTMEAMQEAAAALAGMPELRTLLDNEPGVAIDPMPEVDDVEAPGDVDAPDAPDDDE